MVDRTKKDQSQIQIYVDLTNLNKAVVNETHTTVYWTTQLVIGKTSDDKVMIKYYANSRNYQTSLAENWDFSPFP